MKLITNVFTAIVQSSHIDLIIHLLHGTKHRLRSRHVALPEDPDLLGQEAASNRVQDASVVEDSKVSLLPVNRVDKLRRNAWTLQAVNSIPDFLEVIDDGAILENELLHRAGVNLESELSGDGVAPAHGQDLDLGLVDGRELGGVELETLGDHAEAIRAGFRRRHPDVGMRCILSNH